MLTGSKAYDIKGYLWSMVKRVMDFRTIDFRVVNEV